MVSGNLERVGEMRNPGEFDARQYYASQHIFYFMKKAELLKKSENYSAYRQGMNDLRKYFSEVLNGIGGKEAGILFCKGLRIVLFTLATIIPQATVPMPMKGTLRASNR